MTSKRINAVRQADKLLNKIICLVLAIFLAFGIYSILDTWKLMNGGASGSDLTHFKPKPGEATHQSLKELHALNPDVYAWLTIDNTGIDYPVVQGADNFEYLTLDALKNYSLKGSLFLDYLCDPTFSSSYELIHGHHMVDSMMFGDLEKFENESFFNANQSGYLMTLDSTFKLEIFACLHTEAKDPYVYSTYITSPAFNEVLLNHINDTAICRSDSTVNKNDKILAMSTCASGQTSDRTVVFAKMIEE